MRIETACLLFMVLLLMGCEKNEPETIRELTDGFCMVSNDKVILNHHDIDYYDYSTHLIYLKDNKSFEKDFEEIGAFSVYADGIEIYSGQTFPGYSSYLPSGAVIHTHPYFYGDFVLAIGFTNRFDASGNPKPDPRADNRIIEALKKHDQFHAGLSCEIKSVHYSSPQQVVVELKLKNNDSFNYYYLDPDKMGIQLFHYFNNGLSLRDFAHEKFFTHKMGVTQPEPWDAWKIEWLSIIKSHETKNITLTYTNFENLPPGTYKATFEFPGLGYQVSKNEHQQKDGRIWLGGLSVVKDIVLE